MDLKYLRNIAIYLLSAILSILFIAYIIYHMTSDGQSKLATVNAMQTVSMESITLDAYIMRDEKILYTPTDGLVYYLASDGENVRKNAPVANIYSGDPDDMNQIMQIEKRLRLLRESDVSDSVTTATGNLDSRIQSLYMSTLRKVGNGKLDYVNQNADDLLVQINRRKIAVKSVSNFRAAINNCEDRLSDLMTRFESATGTVTTPVSGNFYAGVDGYENVFTASAAEKMTYDDFYVMIGAQADANLLHNAREGYGIGKIVTNSYWAICCEMSNDYLRNVKEGTGYRIEFSSGGGQQVTMTLDRIIVRFGEDKSILVFGTRNCPEGFNYLRTQSVKLIFNSYTGYKVPSAAVRYVNGEMGVYTLSANKVVFKKTNVLYEMDGFYVVAPGEESDHLQLYDEIIVQGKGLYEGKYIE